MKNSRIMTRRNLVTVLDDIGHWLKTHWFLCLVLIGFILIWRAADVGIRDQLSGNIYPSLLFLVPLLVMFVFSFLVIIYSDMAT